MGSHWIRPRSLFSKIFDGLLFGWALLFFRPDMKFVALPVPEIIAIGVLGGLRTPILGIVGCRGMGIRIGYPAGSPGSQYDSKACIPGMCLDYGYIIQTSLTFFRTVPSPTPYAHFPRVVVHNRRPKLQSLLSQERVKLRTSNLAVTFTGSIQTKAH